MTHEREAALQHVADVFRSTAARLFHEAQVGVGGDHGAAEELVQEVFQALWGARDRICELPVDEQRAWLFGTLRHKVVDRFRRTRHEIAIDPEEFKLLYQARSVPAATRQILVGEVLDRCWRVIERMPPTQQHMFWLRAHEWKTAEIAEHLGITASTVRDHHRRGVQRLNDEVGNGKEIFAAVPTLVEKRLVRDRDATYVAVTLGSCSVRHRPRARTDAPGRTLLSEAKGAGTG